HEQTQRDYHLEGSPAQQSQVNTDDDSHRELADLNQLSTSRFSEASPNMLTELHVGIDDTDSEKGGCTTYTATVLFQELSSRGFKPSDFPWLVRLNPNIPWKTRGNGALSLHFRIEEEKLEEVKKIAVATVERTTDLAQRGTDPAVVFLKGRAPNLLCEFSCRALYDILSVREARQIAQSAGAEVRLLKGSRGLVGALASVGANLDHDHTFEIMAYRTPENI